MIPANFQVARGPFSETRIYVGVEGEFTFTTDVSPRLRVHDGVTPGGIPLLKQLGDVMGGPLSFGGQGHAGLRLKGLSTFQRDNLPSIEPGMIIWNINKNRVEVVNQSRVWVGLATVTVP